MVGMAELFGPHEGTRSFEVGPQEYASLDTPRKACSRNDSAKAASHHGALNHREAHQQDAHRHLGHASGFVRKVCREFNRLEQRATGRRKKFGAQKLAPGEDIFHNYQWPQLHDTSMKAAGRKPYNWTPRRSRELIKLVIHSDLNFDDIATAMKDEHGRGPGETTCRNHWHEIFGYSPDVARLKNEKGRKRRLREHMDAFKAYCIRNESIRKLATIETERRAMKCYSKDCKSCSGSSPTDSETLCPSIQGAWPETVMEDIEASVFDEDYPRAQATDQAVMELEEKERLPQGFIAWFRKTSLNSTGSPSSDHASAKSRPSTTICYSRSDHGSAVGSTDEMCDPHGVSRDAICNFLRSKRPMDDIPASDVQRLIMCGANVNARTEKGETPLHLAVALGAIVICTILLDHGADPEAKTSAGESIWAYGRRVSKRTLNPECDYDKQEQLMRTMVVAHIEFLKATTKYNPELAIEEQALKRKRASKTFVNEIPISRPQSLPGISESVKGDVSGHEITVRNNPKISITFIDGTGMSSAQTLLDTEAIEEPMLDDGGIPGVVLEQCADGIHTGSSSLTVSDAQLQRLTRSDRSLSPNPNKSRDSRIAASHDLRGLISHSTQGSSYDNGPIWQDNDTDSAQSHGKRKICSTATSNSSQEERGEQQQQSTAKRRRPFYGVRSVGEGRYPCIFKVGEPERFSTDTTRYDYISTLLRHLKTHGFFVCGKCFARFANADLEKQHADQENACIKACEFHSCKRHRLPTAFDPPTCRCITTQDQRWDELFNLQYPGVTAPENVFRPDTTIDDRTSLVVNQSIEDVLSFSGMEELSSLETFDFTGIPMPAAPAVATTDELPADPLASRLPMVPAPESRSVEHGAAHWRRPLETTVQQSSEQPTARERQLEVALSNVWGALQRTDSTEAEPGSPLWGLLELLAPSVVSTSRSQSGSQIPVAA